VFSGKQGKNSEVEIYSCFSDVAICGFTCRVYREKSRIIFNVGTATVRGTIIRCAIIRYTIVRNADTGNADIGNATSIGAGQRDAVDA
jgi:hypothetical protein